MEINGVFVTKEHTLLRISKGVSLMFLVIAKQLGNS